MELENLAQEEAFVDQDLKEGLVAGGGDGLEEGGGFEGGQDCDGPTRGPSRV